MAHSGDKDLRWPCPDSSNREERVLDVLDRLMVKIIRIPAREEPSGLFGTLI